MSAFEAENKRRLAGSIAIVPACVRRAHLVRQAGGCSLGVLSEWFWAKCRSIGCTRASPAAVVLPKGCGLHRRSQRCRKSRSSDYDRLGNLDSRSNKGAMEAH